MSYLNNFKNSWANFKTQDKIGFFIALIFMLIFGSLTLFFGIYFWSVFDILIPYYSLLNLQIEIEDYIIIRGILSIIIIIFTGTYLIEATKNETSNDSRTTRYKISRLLFYLIVSGWSWYLLGKALLAIPVGCLAATKIVEWVRENNIKQTDAH